MHYESGDNFDTFNNKKLTFTPSFFKMSDVQNFGKFKNNTQLYNEAVKICGTNERYSINVKLIFTNGDQYIFQNIIHD